VTHQGAHEKFGSTACREVREFSRQGSQISIYSFRLLFQRPTTIGPAERSSAHSDDFLDSGLVKAAGQVHLYCRQCTFVLFVFTYIYLRVREFSQWRGGGANELIDVMNRISKLPGIPYQSKVWITFSRFRGELAEFSRFPWFRSASKPVCVGGYESFHRLTVLGAFSVSESPLTVIQAFKAPLLGL
jgi:hypothetical protein